MGVILIILVLMYIAWNIIMIGCFLATIIIEKSITDLTNFFPDPIFIYGHTNLNWLGVVLVCIFKFIINPIVSIIWLLYKLIYWCTHVGR